VIVGLGIKAIAHATREAEAYVREADKVFFLVADAVSEHWLVSLNTTAESLYGYYGLEKDRRDTYEEMVRAVVRYVDQGNAVCCAFYGHPCVFAYPGREAVKRVRANGGSAFLLPGVSAEDCLFADLGLDPGETGCQSFEATDFLLHQRRFDPRCTLVLWQAAIIGEKRLPTAKVYRHGLKLLVERLSEEYSSDHPVVIYEAAQLVISAPVISTVPLRDLPNADLSPISTLVMRGIATEAPNSTSLTRLGLA
jgi:uncharacterized protein YabN with tetrapyrrole methylase and pyrophosphatase domain